MRFSNKKLGFTLMELLVVISVIALLMAILMPALGKAKYLAQRIVCTSNVRQQSLAFFAYANHNDGKFPRHQERLPMRVKEYKPANAPHPWGALKGNYITNSKILICPITKKFNYYVYKDTKCIFGSNPSRSLGGWDAVHPGTNTPASTIDMAYAWFANFRPYNVSGNPFPGFQMLNRENPWPKNMAECSSSKVFVAHSLCLYSTFLVIRTHGGYYDRDYSISSFSQAKPFDTPVGFSDGHVTIHKQPDVLPRASYIDNLYGYTEIYY